MIIACQRGPGGHCAALCCRCGQREATKASPSGKSQYCDGCAVSRCRRHTIEDFVYDEDLGRWVDPCVLPATPVEQGELWEVKENHGRTANTA